MGNFWGAATYLVTGFDTENDPFGCPWPFKSAPQGSEEFDIEPGTEVWVYWQPQASYQQYAPPWFTWWWRASVVKKEGRKIEVEFHGQWPTGKSMRVGRDNLRPLEQLVVGDDVPDVLRDNQMCRRYGDQLYNHPVAALRDRVRLCRDMGQRWSTLETVVRARREKIQNQYQGIVDRRRDDDKVLQNVVGERMTKVLCGRRDREQQLHDRAEAAKAVDETQNRTVSSEWAAQVQRFEVEARSAQTSRLCFAELHEQIRIDGELQRLRTEAEAELERAMGAALQESEAFLVEALEADASWRDEYRQMCREFAEELGMFEKFRTRQEQDDRLRKEIAAGVGTKLSDFDTQVRREQEADSVLNEQIRGFRTAGHAFCFVVTATDLREKLVETKLRNAMEEAAFPAHKVEDRCFSIIDAHGTAHEGLSFLDECCVALCPVKVRYCPLQTRIRQYEAELRGWHEKEQQARNELVAEGSRMEEHIQEMLQARHEEELQVARDANELKKEQRGDRINRYEAALNAWGAENARLQEAVMSMESNWDFEGLQKWRRLTHSEISTEYMVESTATDQSLSRRSERARRDFEHVPVIPPNRKHTGGILVGLALDVSASMKQSISNKDSSSRMQDVLDAISSFASQYADRRASSVSGLDTIRMFACCFGSSKHPDVRDLFSAAGLPESTMPLEELPGHFEDVLEGFDLVEPYGRTPMYQAMCKIKQRFRAEAVNYERPPHMFLAVVSDGQSNDIGDPASVAAEMQREGVFVMGCYITSGDALDPKSLYNRPEPRWDGGAKLLFQCCSVMERPVATRLKKSMDLTIPRESRLFFQANQSTHIKTFLETILSLENGGPQGQMKVEFSGAMNLNALQGTIDLNDIKCTKIEPLEGQLCIVVGSLFPELVMKGIRAHLESMWRQEFQPELAAYCAQLMVGLGKEFVKEAFEDTEIEEYIPEIETAASDAWKDWDKSRGVISTGEDGLRAELNGFAALLLSLLAPSEANPNKRQRLSEGVPFVPKTGLSLRMPATLPETIGGRTLEVNMQLGTDDLVVSIRDGVAEVMADIANAMSSQIKEKVPEADEPSIRLTPHGSDIHLEGAVVWSF